MSDALPHELRLKSETLIGKGLTSDVFTWGDERVLKLFFRWVPPARIQREFVNSRALAAADVPLPSAFEILQLAQRHGIVLERLRGASMLRRVEKRPWTLFAAARQLAELHAALHTRTAPLELPPQREQIEAWVQDADGVTGREKEAAGRHASRLPAGTALCHGDFHPANIIYTRTGPVIIDWSSATRGHPLADVARTSVLFESASLPEETPPHIQCLMKVARRALHSCYLKRYLQLGPGTLEEIEFWRVPQRLAASAWHARKRAAVARLESCEE